MAIGITVKENAADATITTTPKTTGSVTIAANQWVFVAVTLVNGTTGRTSTVTGSGLTFTKVDEGLYDSNSNSLSWHYARAGGSGFTGTLTITQNNSIQQMHWTTLEVTGLDPTTPVPQSSGINVFVNSNLTATLPNSPANATTSRSIIVASHNVQQALTAGANTTLLAEEAANSPPQSHGVGWSNTAWAATLTLVGGTSSAGAALALELKAAAGGTTFTETPSGALSPSGAAGRVKQAARGAGGSLSPAGVAGRIKSAVRSLTGALSPAATVTLAKTVPKSLAGALSPTGATTRVKFIAKALAGSLSPAATITTIRLRFKALAGALTFNTPSGTSFEWNDGTAEWNDGTATWNSTALSRNYSFLVQYVRGGAITPAGVGTRLKFIGRSFTGALTPAGTLVRSTSKTLSAALALAGVAARTISKTYIGSIAPTGVATTLKFVGRSFAGAITPAGALTRSVLRTASLSGAVSPAGAAIRAVSVIRAGVIAPAGAIANFAAKITSGTLTSSGSLARVVLRTKALSGALSPSSTLVKSTSILKQGILSLAGTLTGSGAQTLNLSGALSPSGAVTQVRSYVRNLSGDLNMTGVAALAASLVRSVAGALSPSGAITAIRVRAIALGGSITPSAVYTAARTAVKTLTADLTLTGTAVRTVVLTKLGSLSFSGVLSTGQNAFLGLSGALSPVGTAIKQWNRVLQAELSLGNGTVAFVRSYAKNLAGFITSDGNAQRFATLSRAFGGAISLNGAIQMFGGAIITFVGSISPSGLLKQASTKVLTGQTFTTGQANKMFIRARGGTLTFAGAATRSIQRVVLVFGALAPAGAVRRLTEFLRGGSLTPTGTSALRWARVLSGALSPSGVVVTIRARFLGLTSSLGFSGATARIKIIPKELGGSIALTGALAKSSFKKLSGVLHLVGLALRVHFIGTAAVAELTVEDDLQVLLVVREYRQADFDVRTTARVAVMAGEQ